ncbi:hypothetical protein MRB53_030514 [Persea americana]|uniref:Uncharacterized protein n=1 Tax=Persea americana TaxID=3435 RepID=A0ACC2KLW2_PERAE|nr:hypothetical protein MRB53_030514 [Persea americana]
MEEGEKEKDGSITLLPGASAAGADVCGASGDAHADSAALGAAAGEHAPAAGHDTAAEVAGLLGQLDE